MSPTLVQNAFSKVLSKVKILLFLTAGKVGLPTEQANEIIGHVRGKYPNDVPRRTEIWTEGEKTTFS